MYDYLVVGSGLFGSTFAYEAKKRGQKALLIDKRDHIGGNIYTREEHGINVHVYGPHIFHSKNKEVWDYVNQFAAFHPYQHHVKAFYERQIYSLPFNMMTFYQLWGCITPREAKERLLRERVRIEKPTNLEEWALSQVGTEIYEKFIWGYTKKQWRRDPKQLPISITLRIPVRFTYDDNYYHDGIYQGIPIGGYTRIIENMLDGIEVKLSTDFSSLKSHWETLARKLIYTGPIDAFFDYQFGPLEYLGLDFEHSVVDGNWQGLSQLNFTDINVMHTRDVEHKHFEGKEELPKSVVTREFPIDWEPGKEPYYPVNDKKNKTLLRKYQQCAKKTDNVIFGGRLASYRYLNMDSTVAAALSAVKEEFGD